MIDRTRPGRVPADPQRRQAGSGSAAARPQWDSKLEQAYSQYLYCRQLAKEIRTFRYHGIRLELTDKTSYRPDFIVWLADGAVEIHEVKGWSRNVRDGLTRLSIAAGLFPWWTFVLVRRHKGRWVEKVITP